MWPNGDESLVACPYNRYHLVHKLKIQRHLMKCKKNYPDVKLATCFYNFSHKLRPEELLKHYETCSHRTRMEGARYYEPGTYNPVNSSTNDDDDDDDNQCFSFPKTTARTEKHFFNPHKYPRHVLKSNFECANDFKDLNFDYESILSDTEKKDISGSELAASSDDDSDDMKPLPLPKTISKAFTCIKQNQEKSSMDSSRTETQPRGFGRAKNILRFSSPKSEVTGSFPEDSLPDRSVVGSASSESKISKFPSRNANSCSASVVSSLFDDANTLISQDIIFDDEDDDTVNEHLILKNFDKYVKI